METRPIEDIGKIEPSNYYMDHWFLYSIADYVDDDCDPDDTIETLMQMFTVADAGLIETFKDEDGEGVIFKEGFVRAYMEREYKAFEQALRDLRAKATVDAFCQNKLGLEMCQLRETYDDKFGFYIQNEDEGLVTLTSFVRSIKSDTKYYFGGTVDYHF